ncbi:carbohydrate esterase, putative (DUF303) isoform X1 [Wolffia australiana]
MEEEEKEVDLLPPGDVFLLAGQSNMAGRGGVAHRRWDGVVPIECRPRPQILRFSAQSRWTLAEEPIHADIDAAKTCGVGPAMPFASALLSASPRPIGLVPCAVGGTAIADWAKGKKLYERMVGRAREALQWGAELKALLWFQGESDASSRESASAYGSNMEKLVSDLRSDLGLPSLPVIQVAICSGEGKWVEKVRSAQLGMTIPHVVCVDAKGLQLNEDHLHLSTPAQVKLGRMMAEKYVDNFLSHVPLEENDP